MRPKVKFRKEEIVQAALDVARVKGADGVTARDIAAQLGVSTRPIFTYFNTMDEVKAAVRQAAEGVYQDYTTKGLSADIPFLGFGLQYLRFAKEEPELYKLLFLTPPCDEDSGAVAAMTHTQGLVRDSLRRIYHINAAAADRYFRDMWLVVHSLATLMVTGGCPYSQEEMSHILTECSVSLCLACKKIPGFAEGEFDRDAVFRSLTQADASE